jgi:exosortase
MTKATKLLYFQVALLSALFIFLYFPFIRTMVHDWSIDDNYSHGYLVPFIAAYMIWTIRKELKEVTISPSNWGILLIVLGLAQLTVGKIGSELFLQRTSIIITLFGILLFLLGKEFTKKITVPLVYLVFMVPIPAIIWNKVAFPMKLFASYIAANIIDGIGITILREGNILHLTSTTLEVADACSGLRSLMSLLALSAAVAYIFPLRTTKKWTLFFSAVPIAIAVNICRLVLTAILAQHFGAQVAEGFLHEISGILVFVIAFLLLFMVYSILSKLDRNEISPTNQTNEADRTDQTA